MTRATQALRSADGWAAFAHDGEMVIWSIGWRRSDTVKEVVEAYGEPWRAVRRRYGLRLARVVMLPAPEARSGETASPADAELGPGKPKS